MKRFKPKVEKERKTLNKVFSAIIIIGMVVMSIFLLMEDPIQYYALLFLLLVGGIVLFVNIRIYRSMFYEIDRGFISFYQLGMHMTQISIRSIVKIDTRRIASNGGYPLSRDAMNLVQEDGYRFSLSVLDKVGFVSCLLRVNPKIELSGDLKKLVEDSKGL